MRRRGHLDSGRLRQAGWGVDAHAGTPRWVRRRRSLVVGGCLAALVSITACSETARYRVLSFFFDGVPRPGEQRPEGYALAAAPSVIPGTGEGSSAAPRLLTHAHPPYRDQRCGACHDPTSGELYRTPQEGLCAACHTDIPGEAPYVHGPVAVRDCLFCHHPHGSIHPRILRADVVTLCLRCHEETMLRGASYHEALDQTKCVDCHDAHAGEARFYLKRTEH